MKRGRPTKARGGLTKVLFVRLQAKDLKYLDGAASRLSERKQFSVSRSDVVRLMIAHYERHSLL